MRRSMPCKMVSRHRMVYTPMAQRSVFPNQTFNSSNYWVDVVFSSGPAPTLNSIAVTPANPTIQAGGTQQFTATGTYSDGSTQNITSQVTWASATTTVATINASGLASGVAARDQQHLGDAGRSNT